MTVFCDIVTRKARHSILNVMAHMRHNNSTTHWHQRR